MKINKEKLEALAALPDDMLWKEIVNAAATYGFAMPKETPPHEKLEQLRDAVRGQRVNTAEALKILNSYRKGK